MADAASEVLRAELLNLAREISEWTPVESREALATLSGLAIIAGTRGHADHVRVAEALSRLRKIIRAVERATQEEG